MGEGRPFAETHLGHLDDGSTDRVIDQLIIGPDSAVIVFARKWILRVAFALFRPLPVIDRIVIASSHTTRLSGNLEFIHDELTRRGCTFPSRGSDAALGTRRSSAGSA